jgi:hypothetical protein
MEVKLVAPLGDSISATGPSSLVGNIICFPHDGSKAAAARLLYPATFPWIEDILDIITVTFIGTDKQYDHYMKHAFGCAELKVRGPVVISWLKILKVMNALYAGVLIDDSPESFSKLLQLANKIVENVKRLTDNESINVERTLGSDIAGVRMHPSNGADENSPDDVKKFECTTLLPSSKVAILTPILVTDSAVIYWLPKVNDERVEIFQQIRDVINPIQAMKTSTIPLNEFTENDRLILGAFPHLFLLGVPGNHSLTHDLYSHYMNQFTGAMARESQFFFLSN